MNTDLFPDFKFGTKPYVIAEIGNNHEGDFEHAKELLNAAADAGADAVKFQTITPEKLVTSDQSNRIAQLRRFHLTHEQFETLAELANNRSVEFFSTPFDLDAVDRLDLIQRLFKISSGDNTYDALVEKIAGKGKPTLISTGGMRQEDIIRLQRVFSAAAVDRAELILLHCVSLYPTLPVDAQLWRISWLIKQFPNTVIGYSDHTLGVEACKTAVALGARVLEKHFTLDKHKSDFRDHQLSADPTELSLLIKECNDVVSYVGTSTSERPDQAMSGVRRAAIAIVDIAKGTTIEPQHIKWLRSTNKDALRDASMVIGQTCLKNINIDHPILPEHIGKN